MSPIVGIVGAGQLARMTVEAASPLGIRVHVLAEHAGDSAARVAASTTLGAGTLARGLAPFAQRCDVVTFDHELVSVVDVRQLEADGVRFWPNADTVAVAQNKWEQRTRFQQLGLPVPAFAAADSVTDVDRFAERHAWPVVLKAVLGGYDGRGVWIARDHDEAGQTLSSAGQRGMRVFVEQFLPIERECAGLVCRRPRGDTVAYSIVDTVQKDGICHELAVPSSLPRPLTVQAQRTGTLIAGHLGVVGILAVEFFVANGQLWVNEIAARPHNSGHFSIEGCITSQFENHLRAILDWPLGDTGLVAPHVTTVNILGSADGADPRVNLPLALSLPQVKVHLYAKKPRPGRKLGHVTVLGDDRSQTRALAWQAVRLLTGGSAEDSTGVGEVA
ncbi:MAG: 5-(carboxyamino)imidazole ribonucleotide synthase [Chloroflexi bacterium]|nr:5-(carboxyamino)imidazole ribonucleotide synthase [Chloroflexota bacterium]